MPKIPIDECPAGPAMNAAVAEALGYCPHDLEKTIHWSEDGCGEVCYECKGCHKKFWGLAYREGYLISPYSTDIAAAWEMESTLEVDQQSDYVMALFNLVAVDLGAPDFYAFKKSVYWRMAHANPLIRCRAFLKASGVEYIEVLNED